MSTQLAIRLPDGLLAEFDWLVVRCDYANRTEAMRAAIEQLIRREKSREIDEQYIEAYTKWPQTEDESVRLENQTFAGLDDDDEDWSWLEWRRVRSGGGSGGCRVR